MELISPICSRCVLSETRLNVVQPDIPEDCRVLFLGRDPGQLEDKTGRPFHPDAPAGKLLRRMIHDVGIPLEWCGFDNSVRCHTPANRGPRSGEVLACSIYTRLLHRRYPPLLVTLGVESLDALFRPGTYRPTKPIHVLGEVHGGELEYRGHTVIPMYHPSAGLRNGLARRSLLTDLRGLARRLGIAPPEPTYVPCDGWELPFPTILAVDLETSKVGEIITVGLAWRDHYNIMRGIAYEDSSVSEALVAVQYLAQRQSLVAHNLQFEYEKFFQAGYRLLPDNLHDTLLMAYVLRREVDVGSLGLKELALADLGLSWPTMDELGHPEDMEPTVRQHYCIQDCVATLLLYEKYSEMLREEWVDDDEDL